MSLSFACPMCQARMEVADDLAGRAGQCPRCRHVFSVPGPAVNPAAEPVAPVHPWPSQPTQPPPAAAVASPRNGSGKRWLIVAVLALIVAPLVFTGIIKLTGSRKPSAVNRKRASVAVGADHVTSGRLQGEHAFLDKGVFQVQTELTHNDPLFNAGHSKRYEIELIAKHIYVIEHDSLVFDPAIRVFEQNNEVAARGTIGVRKTALVYTPSRGGIHTIYATCVQPAFGPSTLTVREVEAAAP